MAGDTLDRRRVLAELNARGIRYVVVNDLERYHSDRVEICIADDDEDIGRLRMMLIAHDAQQDGLSDDPHHAVFHTDLGRLELTEMAADAEFAELERRAEHVDFGNGVIARAAARPENVHIPEAPEFEFVDLGEASYVEERSFFDRLRRRRDEPTDASSIEGRLAGLGHRIWRKFEDIDDFLSGLGDRSLRHPRGDE